MHNAYSSTHSLKRLTIQQQHTGWVKKCNYHGKNLAMLSFRNNVILIKSNVRNIKAWTTQRIEHFFKSFLETKRINSFDCQL